MKYRLLALIAVLAGFTACNIPAKLDWASSSAKQQCRKDFADVKYNWLIIHCLNGVDVGKTLAVSHLANENDGTSANDRQALTVKKIEEDCRMGALSDQNLGSVAVNMGASLDVIQEFGYKSCVLGVKQFISKLRTISYVPNIEIKVGNQIQTL